jgi:hypothetical protein
MSAPNERSNVVWIVRRRLAESQDGIASLEADLARERDMLARRRANNSDVGNLERCIEMTKAMLAIARA